MDINEEKDKADNVQNDKYNAGNIEFYQGCEAVRKRPGMYIGNVETEEGILNMINEIIDNSVDEHMAGHGNEIVITLGKDNNIKIEDFGRGIPVDMHKTGYSSLELVLTQLHAGGKFNKSSYRVSGGLHGVGAAVVIALSKTSSASSFRDGKEHKIFFEKGKKVGDIQITNSTRKNGTIIQFMPDETIFSTTNVDESVLINRIHELAYLNSNLKFQFINELNPKNNQTIFHAGGIKDFLLSKYKEFICDPVLIESENKDCFLYLAWIDSSKEDVKTFTNNICQKNGGTHLTGLRHSVAKVLLKYYTQNTSQNQQIDLLGEDTRCGMVGVLSVYLEDPKFTSQTKEQLSSKNARTLVENTVSSFLEDWMGKNPTQVKKLMEHVVQCGLSRINFKKTKETLKDYKNELSVMPHHFANCRSNNPEEKELIIVEGESAGGSAKTGRNPKYQAILAIQGKLLNVQKAPIWKFLKTKGFPELITVLGCGIGASFDIKRINFHKIIIMTDADVDGRHIATLLLTFFFKHMIEVITHGYLYIARPPLFKINLRGKQEKYIDDNLSLRRYFYDNFFENVQLTNCDFTMEDYQDILEYKKIIQDSWQNINHMFISKLLVAGILDVFHNKTSIEDIENRFHKDEKSTLKLSLEEKNEDFILITLQYQSFYTKHLTKIKFTREFDLLIGNIIHKIISKFSSGIDFISKNKNYKFFEPLSMISAIENIVRSNVYIQRYKGLGEMDPEELKEVIDPTDKSQPRNIEQVYFDEVDLESIKEIFDILLGPDSQKRQQFIFDNYEMVQQ